MDICICIIYTQIIINVYKLHVFIVHYFTRLSTFAVSSPMCSSPSVLNGMSNVTAVINGMSNVTSMENNSSGPNLWRAFTDRSSSTQHKYPPYRQIQLNSNFLSEMERNDWLNQICARRFGPVTTRLEPNVTEKAVSERSDVISNASSTESTVSNACKNLFASNSINSLRVRAKQHNAFMGFLDSS